MLGYFVNFFLILHLGKDLSVNFSIMKDSSAQNVMTHKPFYKRVWELYYDGFRNMTVGKSLWLLIIIKLFIMFVIVKWIFFKF